MRLAEPGCGAGYQRGRRSSQAARGRERTRPSRGRARDLLSPHRKGRIYLLFAYDKAEANDVSDDGKRQIGALVEAINREP